MTYRMPDELRDLRQWLAERGADVDNFASERQAAFIAQKLADQRFKFPADRTASCFPILKKIQAIVCHGAKASRPVPKPGTIELDQSSPRGPVAKKQPNPRTEGANGTPVKEPGLAIYCDGACEPNPGAGGWGVAVYLDGKEIDSRSGGLAETTNNAMELTGLLMSLSWLEAEQPKEPALILCDSQYVVQGINDWAPKWRANGWRRKGGKAKAENQAIANLDLWKLTIAARERLPHVAIGWVRGHAGHEGNERADELSLIGREESLPEPEADMIEDQLRYEI
ncbi:hypothetical protein GRZ55_11680 [Chelativorans sp. ZYF759]|uniref:ribonuclease H family protein n=1 Tax=Chelativorans sp. ZYF759 TaxID=2692213 RepID=UPI00145CD2F1|nr:ribonuclease H [Chelativorans sp. ZYF759]NMG39904.1 hypothetical protein [Chelativorans sp. ZYF759]